MARFDLYRRPDGSGFLVDVQSDHLYRLPTRMVIPLLPRGEELPPIRDLNPLIPVAEETWVLMPQYMAAVHRRELGPPLGNLLDQADDITRALNILLTGF